MKPTLDAPKQYRAWIALEKPILGDVTEHQLSLQMGKVIKKRVESGKQK